MKDAQSSARKTSAADIRRSGRLSVYERLFAAQVQRDPDAVAIEQGGSRRSYGALNERAVRLAAALHGKGVRYGDRIGLRRRTAPNISRSSLPPPTSAPSWLVRIGGSRLPNCSIAWIWSRLLWSLPRGRFASNAFLRSICTASKASSSRTTTKRWWKPPYRSPSVPGGRPGGRARHPVHQRHDGPAQGCADQPPRPDRPDDRAAAGHPRHRGGRLRRLGAAVPHGLDRPDARRPDVRSPRDRSSTGFDAPAHRRRHGCATPSAGSC